MTYFTTAYPDPTRSFIFRARGEFFTRHVFCLELL